MYSDPQSFLSPQFHFAVVGASNDKAKTGFYVYAFLKKQQFSVFPVNSFEKNIQGDPCFPNLIRLRPFPDVVIFTLPQQTQEQESLQVLRDMRDMGIFRLWVELGSETEDITKLAEKEKISIITGFSVQEEIEKIRNTDQL